MPADWGTFAVDRQAADKESTLNLYRQALKLRRELRTQNTMEWANSDKEVLHFSRPGGWQVMTNFGGEAVQPPAGEILLTTAPLERGRLGKYTTVWVKA